MSTLYNTLDFQHTLFQITFVLLQGSCRVLKKLKKVQSRLTEHQERVVGFERGGCGCRRVGVGGCKGGGCRGLVQG